jgi:hypothetical protein
MRMFVPSMWRDEPVGQFALLVEQPKHFFLS